MSSQFDDELSLLEGCKNTYEYKSYQGNKLSNATAASTNVAANVNDFTFDDNDLEIKQDHDINNRIAEHTHHILSLFKSSINQPKFINPPKTASTNIIDRSTGKCYKIPDDFIHTFFNYLDECRKKNFIKLMFYEKQQEYSGIMFD
jgi:hypothetical protein